MSSFELLGLSDQVLQAITEMEFDTPTEIQEKSIPFLLQENRDFIGLAQTGTGKTAAFGLPLLDLIDPTDRATQALILAPTRELGQQIAQQLKVFGKYSSKVNMTAVYGGANIQTQIKALKKPQQIIIATPGRLLDLINRRSVKLDQLAFLVLDEADEMLNMGFKEELDKILSHTPPHKRTWLFSATMPPEIRRIVKQYMKDPYEVKVSKKNEINSNITHQYSMVKNQDKTEALTRFINANPDMRAVVFCRTKRDTQQLAEELMRHDFKADAIHGDLSQNQRDNVMNRFRQNKLQLLIATDVAARGIDVSNLSHVFHYAIPDDASYYTHRSGRTARAGKKGISLAFINGREKGRLGFLEKKLGINFENVRIPDNEDILEEKIEKWSKDVLNTSTKATKNDSALQKAILLFGNLSKEELLAKIIAFQFQSEGNGSDLNMSEQAPSSEPKSRKRFNRRISSSKPGNRGGNFKRKRKSNRYKK